MKIINEYQKILDAAEKNISIRDFINESDKIIENIKKMAQTESRNIPDHAENIAHQVQCEAEGKYHAVKKLVSGGFRSDIKVRQINSMLDNIVTGSQTRKLMAGPNAENVQKTIWG